MQEEVIFPRPLINQLLHQAQVSPDTEICGLIGSHHGIPTSCYPVRNIAARPAVRFRLDPEEQIAAMRRMRENHEDLFAIYHSHPSAPAEPSATDLEQANYPDALQIIISLNTKGVLEMRGFRFRASRPIEEIMLGIRNE
ncbi:MAG: M67 family metallopeptidase [Methylococcaceae bacterium]|nr:M67 family metallopeptidase [Methylococcaceae bacterium]MCI0667317.1 M67 family metallopeptidase [Methylococcaceae bacterium]MCI0733201.1 M67 family metallopeptidase [Methylococcaceae bacterium]